MKKLCFIAVFLGLLFTLAACGGQPDSSNAVSSSLPIQTNSSFFTGRVTDASMHQLTVEDENGKSACFLLTDDTVYSFIESGSLIVDMRVTVSYIGTLSQQPAALTVTETQAPPIETHTFTGIVMDASMNNIRVLSEEHLQVDFSLNDKVVYNITGGLVVNMKVSVVYTGELVDGSAAGCNVTRIDELEPAPVVTHSFTGKVVDASMYSLLVENEEGQQVDFNLNDEVNYALGEEGILAGMYVVIDYTGTIIDGSAAGCTVVNVTARP